MGDNSHPERLNVQKNRRDPPTDIESESRTGPPATRKITFAPNLGTGPTLSRIPSTAFGRPPPSSAPTLHGSQTPLSDAQPSPSAGPQASLSDAQPSPSARPQAPRFGTQPFLFAGPQTRLFGTQTSPSAGTQIPPIQDTLQLPPLVEADFLINAIKDIRQRHTGITTRKVQLQKHMQGMSMFEKMTTQMLIADHTGTEAVMASLESSTQQAMDAIEVRHKAALADKDKRIKELEAQVENLQIVPGTGSSIAQWLQNFTGLSGTPKVAPVTPANLPSFHTPPSAVPSIGILQDVIMQDTQSAGDEGLPSEPIELRSKGKGRAVDSSPQAQPQSFFEISHSRNPSPADAAETDEAVVVLSSSHPDTQGGQPQSSTQGDPAQSSTQGDQPQPSTQGDQPQPSTQGDQPQSSTQGDPAQSSTQGGQPQSSTQGGQPQSSTQGGQPQSSTQGGQPQSSTQGGQLQSSTQGGQPQSSTQGGQPQSSTQGGPPQSGTQGGQPQPSTQGGQPQPSSSAQGATGSSGVASASTTIPDARLTTHPTGTIAGALTPVKKAVLLRIMQSMDFLDHSGTDPTRMGVQHLSPALLAKLQEQIAILVQTKRQDNVEQKLNTQNPRSKGGAIAYTCAMTGIAGGTASTKMTSPNACAECIRKNRFCVVRTSGIARSLLVPLAEGERTGSQSDVGFWVKEEDEEEDEE